MMISMEGGQLIAQVSGQGKAPLSASSDVRFFYKAADAEVEFTKDEKGTVVGLVLHQGGGQDLKAPKTSDRVPMHKEIPVSPKILEQYVGTYEIRPGFDLTITLEGDQLMTQATGQPKFPLYAESETKFFLKVVDAETEFVKDDKGVVTYLIHRQGPSEIKAPKK